MEQGMLAERFWAKVDPDPDGGCWQWMGSISATGYGSVRTDARSEFRTALPHRVAYELLVGPIPDGLTLDHLCRNRSCVNPTHLEPVSLRENVLRGESPMARNARKTHCKRGRDLAEESTYVDPNGWRTCRICRTLNRINRKENKDGTRSI